MTLAVGVIGLGVMGAEPMRLLSEEPGGAQIVAVCDADQARAKALAGKAQVFSDPMALFALSTATLTNPARQHGHCFPANWLPRFADAYRFQMRAWVDWVATGRPVGVSAWDGYVATADAEQVVTALQTGAKAQLFLGARPGLYT